VDDPDERVRIRIRQRLDQHAVHNAENCCRGADGEPQRHDTCGGEDALLPSASNRV
jgi:hypothetical protein